MAHILDIATDIAQGLDFAHDKGFVHRDVKPGNVLFRKDGRVVLADFGIAKAMDGSNSSTVAGSSIGTPDYMSPEQARGEPVDGRSDLYGLGTVLFEMLTGAPPYQAGDPFTVALMHVTHPVPTLPEPYEWLQPLVAGLMAKEAAKRYNTGAAFIDALHTLVETAPQGAVLQETSLRKAGGGGRIAAGAATQQRTRISARQSGGRPAWLLPAAGLGVFGAALLAWWLQTPAAPESTQTSPPPLPAPARRTPARKRCPTRSRCRSPWTPRTRTKSTVCSTPATSSTNTPRKSSWAANSTTPTTTARWATTVAPWRSIRKAPGHGPASRTSWPSIAPMPIRPAIAANGSSAVSWYARAWPWTARTRICASCRTR